jgi:hypothetical protein
LTFILGESGAGGRVEESAVVFLRRKICGCFYKKKNMCLIIQKVEETAIVI